MNWFPAAVLAAVIFLIAMRGRWTGYRIWHVMGAGALLVLSFGCITPPRALGFVNLDVMLFLFGMFAVGEALEQSGYLERLAQVLYSRGRNAGHIVLLTLFGMGFASALLMNDTLAIVGTPIMLYMASRHRIDRKLLLLALAFSITIGSAMSPIGNPQNLLIAVEGHVENPFMTFGRYLLAPTAVNLLVAYVWLRFLYGEEFAKPIVPAAPAAPRDPKTARLCKVSLALALTLIAIKVALAVAGSDLDFKLTYIALASAAPIIILSPRRGRIIRGMDWSTLLFFAAMFVLMGAVWESGVMQSAISGLGMNPVSILAILLISAILSQVMSNVPLVALYLPLMMSMGASTGELMALAAGSTIAGNMLVLGAASNIIIIQSAERHGNGAFSFWEFAKAGIPLTAMNLAVYWLFLTIL